ncbi:MAG: sugar-binding protein [Armatimonadota bacterium]|nr:sugar-binding protein [Armatimonadota bacterium]MCX7777951.1 sugar-binding protein [Armatimonadota bacterium]MDW8025292.1 sugar-binding protein [Armatimonadota bacterium]
MRSIILKRAIALALMFFASSIFIFGCQRAAERNIKTGSKSATGKKTDSVISIAIVPKALTGEYWARCKRGVMKAQEELGVRVDFIGPPSEVDVDKQVEIVENLISRGVDGIGISPCDGDALVPVIEKAIAKGIPVVTVDSDANTDKRLCYIGTDNRKAGRVAGEQMVKLLGGKGKVLIITGVPGAQNLMERVAGFKEVVSKHPGIKIISEQACQSDQVLALNIAENALTADKDLAGIFGVNAFGAPGAAQAVESRGLAGKVKIVGFDAMPDTLKFCADGVVQAIVEQRPYRMGYLAVKLLKDAIEGKKIPRVVDTGVDVITPSEAKKLLRK